MRFPNNAATRATERVMSGIREHVKPGGLNPGEVHHYNRVYEAVYAALSEAYAHGRARGLDEALNSGDGSYRP